METFTSGGRRIHVDVLEPPGKGMAPAILLLHGSGGNFRFWMDRLAPHVARLGVSIYAVHYFDRTGTVRADAATILDGRHFPQWLETVQDALSFVAARERTDPRRIVLLGISLGAFLALAASSAARTGPAVRAVVEISGGLPDPYAARATSAFPPTLILHGEADTVVPVQLARDLDRRLSELGVVHQARLFPGEGHWFSAGAQIAILLAIAGFLSSTLSATSGAPAPGA